MGSRQECGYMHAVWTRKKSGGGESRDCDLGHRTGPLDRELEGLEGRCLLTTPPTNALKPKIQVSVRVVFRESDVGASRRCFTGVLLEIGEGLEEFGQVNLRVAAGG